MIYRSVGGTRDPGPQESHQPSEPIVTRPGPVKALWQARATRPEPRTEQPAKRPTTKAHRTRPPPGATAATIVSSSDSARATWLAMTSRFGCSSSPLPQ